MTAPISSSRIGPPHNSAVPPFERRPQQHEIAVARADIGDDLVVAVAGGDALAHQHAQIVREVGLGILDRLVAADQAAQFLADRRGRAPPAPGRAASRRAAPPGPGPAMTARAPGSARRQDCRNRRVIAASRWSTSGRIVLSTSRLGQRADMLVADAPGAIDDEGLGDAVDAPIDADPAVIGADPRIGIAELGDPGERRVGLVLVVDAVDRHALLRAPARSAPDAPRGTARTTTRRC